ncbi:MAG: hypothetical protein ACR2LC_03085 [Pyrinomonadaceae bacterium]
MYPTQGLTCVAVRRKNERGAALLTTLLISMLLLAAGGALIVSTSLTTSNTYDSTAEAKAYYSAEAGLQASLNVLRGKVTSSPAGVTMSFRNALTLATSNDVAGGDATTYARLSRWLPYSTRTTPGTNVAVDSNNTGYNIKVTDPDNSNLVSFTTTGSIDDGSNTKTFPGLSPSSSATITINDVTGTNINAYPTAANQQMISIRVQATRFGATIPETKFSIRIHQTAPFEGVGYLTGKITPGTITNTTSTVQFNYTLPSTKVNEGTYTVNSNPLPLVAPNVSGGVTTALASITAPDPQRLLVQSTGTGPKGARKQLEMIVNSSLFNVAPPSPITIRGADDQSQSMTFSLGTSNAKYYTGKDNAGIEGQQPTVAISLHDWTAGNAGVIKGSTVDAPQLSVLDINPIPNPWTPTLLPVPASPPPTALTPYFLRTADAARRFLDSSETTARAQGRYYTSLNGYADTGVRGDAAFTFVDGDCNLDGGTGLLIVTGNLTLKGNNGFDGIIILLGNGHVERSGGGNGGTYGAMVIGSVDRTAGDFRAPYFDVSGGGGLTFQSDYNSKKRANNISGLGVAGVIEK